jgi:hypothetical protein
MKITQLRQLIREEIESVMNEETPMIPPALVNRYLRMKSVFDDKAGDIEFREKIKPIVTTFFPKNLDVSYKELVNKYGREVARGVVVFLFSAYIDGYLDHFKDPISRLHNEWRDFMKQDISKIN